MTSGLRRIGTGVLLAIAVGTPITLVFLGLAPPPVGLMSLAIVAGLVVFVLRDHAPALMLVFVTVAVLTTLVRSPWLNFTPAEVRSDSGAALAERWRSAGTFVDTLPVVIHIVLDEMMSVGAMGDDLPGGGATASAIRRLITRHGLRSYESIYSRNFFSGISIPNLMDAEYVGATRPGALRSAIDIRPESNAYFADMETRGYRTAVFQSAVIDFCAPQSVDLCETFPSFDPGSGGESSLDERTRVVYLWDTLFRALEPSYVSASGRWLLRRLYGIDQRELGVLGTADRFDVQGFGKWFDRFVAFISGVPRGTHVFAHFMVPHSPYVLSEGCVVSGRFDSGYYLGERTVAGAERERARLQHYNDYLRQVRCATAKLDELLTAIRSEPTLDDAVVVIHGDHGSRISVGERLEDLQPRDFIDNFATFFAIMSPASEPGIDCEFTSLPQVFRRVMDPTRAPDGDAPLPVILATRAGNDVRVTVPMPRFGCGAGS